MGRTTCILISSLMEIDNSRYIYSVAPHCTTLLCMLSSFHYYCFFRLRLYAFLWLFLSTRSNEIQTRPLNTLLELFAQRTEYNLDANGFSTLGSSVYRKAEFYNHNNKFGIALASEIINSYKDSQINNFQIQNNQFL